MPVRYSVVAVLCLTVCAGCRPEDSSGQEEIQPRPVTVLELKYIQPQELALHTGTVSSWKTDQIGFQVGGRIQQLLEPGTNIEGASF